MRLFELSERSYIQVFLRRFRDPIWVPRISNRVPRIRENYHRVTKIRENRVPRIREIGSLQIHTGYLTFSLKKKPDIFVLYFLFLLQIVEILKSGTVVASVPYSIAFASRSKKNYDVTEAYIANKFVSLDSYVAALCNLDFPLCGSYMELVWPPLLYAY